MGGKQLGFSDYELTTAKKQTKRERFLSEMEEVVPWQALIDLIEPHYPKTSKKGGSWLPDTTTRPVATERVSPDWVGR
jgi:IS5 family transposase